MQLATKAFQLHHPTPSFVPSPTLIFLFGQMHTPQRICPLLCTPRSTQLYNLFILVIWVASWTHTYHPQTAQPEIQKQISHRASLVRDKYCSKLKKMPHFDTTTMRQTVWHRNNNPYPNTSWVCIFGFRYIFWFPHPLLRHYSGESLRGE